MDVRPVLVIDDHAYDLYLTREAIEAGRPGTLVKEAQDGAEALEGLETDPLPALILLDIKLPGMDGLEILQGIRALPRTRFIPVVMLTSSDLTSDLKAAYESGASGYIHKAQDLETFIQLLKGTLHYWLDLNRIPRDVNVSFRPPA